MGPGGSGEEKAGRLAAIGLDPDTARAMARWQNEDMQWAILRLYRSAAQPAMAERGQDLPLLAHRPGLHVLATGDHFVGSEEMRRRATERAGARLAVLDGPGHWWMVEDPATAARTLTEFWAGVTA